jgi:hypothetical protein
MNLAQGRNPYPLLLPDSLVLGHLSAAMSTFIKASAWEIGERFDSILTRRHGPSWLVNTYGDYRTPEVHDPDFVFNWHQHDSILWDALPPFSPQLRERFGKARITRNRWEHESAHQNMSSFLNGVDQIHRLAHPLGLETAAYAPQLSQRVKVLQRAGGVLPPSDLELQLESEKELAEEARRIAEEAAESAAQAVLAAELHGAIAEEALKAKHEAMAQVAAAQEDVDRLETALRDAERASRQAVSEPADDLKPGDAWSDLPLGLRVLTLKKNMVDLMDPATQTLLSQQVGGVAHEAACRWLEFMPDGGRVHLTPAGHACGEVGGRYTYLGRLDPA